MAEPLCRPNPVSPRGAGVSATPTDTVARWGGSRGCGVQRARRPKRARLGRDSAVESSVALGGVLTYSRAAVQLYAKSNLKYRFDTLPRYMYEKNLDQ